MGPDGQPVATGWVSGPAVINIIEMNGPEMTSLSQMSNSLHLKEGLSKLKTLKFTLKNLFCITYVLEQIRPIGQTLKKNYFSF